MSTVKVQGNASGTGSITLASPNTNNNRTINLPDVDGSFVTADASGNVGIGTSSPATKLDVNGDLTQRNGSGVTIGKVWNDAGLYSIAADSANVNGLKLSANGTQYISLWTNGSERARIDSSGNVLVGTTTNITGNARLSVNQTGSATWAQFIQVGNTTNGIGITNTSGTAAYTALGFYNNGTSFSNCGLISVSGTTTSYATSSDYRLKDNVQPMTGALSVVAQLKPVTYTWKADGSAGQGFIAHELQEVVPDCVTGEKDAVETYIDEEGNEQTRPVYQGIDTSFLVATLTAAIQEQQAMIEEMKTEIAALKGATQ